MSTSSAKAVRQGTIASRESTPAAPGQSEGALARAGAARRTQQKADAPANRCWTEGPLLPGPADSSARGRASPAGGRCDGLAPYCGLRYLLGELYVRITEAVGRVEPADELVPRGASCRPNGTTSSKQLSLKAHSRTSALSSRPDPFGSPFSPAPWVAAIASSSSPPARSSAPLIPITTPPLKLFSKSKECSRELCTAALASQTAVQTPTRTAVTTVRAGSRGVSGSASPSPTPPHPRHTLARPPVPYPEIDLLQNEGQVPARASLSESLTLIRPCWGRVCGRQEERAPPGIISRNKSALVRGASKGRAALRNRPQARELRSDEDGLPLRVPEQAPKPHPVESAKL
ncbi:uncharacterized protein LOC134789340 [Penaeus indicus]|uniref:uncharacterized protein LOC134789340 n=1 Tax=Penaeus indicus TaxID=29960 RepID=UPI00300C4941